MLTLREAPQLQVSDPVPESPDESAVPHTVDHEREHKMGVQMKEGMMEKYHMAVCSADTPQPAEDNGSYSDEVQRSHQCMDGWQSIRCTELP